MDELRKFLARHGLSQTDLADAIGVTNAFVSLLLAGKSGASLSTAKDILGFCRQREPWLTFEQLFGESALPHVANE